MIEVERSPELRIKSAVCSLKLRANALKEELKERGKLTNFWGEKVETAKTHADEVEAKGFLTLAEAQYMFASRELLFVNEVLKELEK